MISLECNFFFMIKTKFQVFLEKNPKYKEKLKPPKIGDIVLGKVVEEDQAGVYLEIPGFALGFLPKKELAGEELKEGEEIKVKIQDFLPKEGLVLFSLKEAKEVMAWQEFEEMETTKDWLTLKTTGANKGGLIFELSGIQGFLPASQLSKEHYPNLKDPSPEAVLEALKKFVGKEFKVKILRAERNQKKLILTER